jgi:hypothetical protein
VIYIYLLYDPADMSIRYVGQTKRFNRRYKEHCTLFKNKCHRVAWLRSLHISGVKPIIEIIDKTEDQDTADRLEIYNIWWRREENYDLVNEADGGCGGAPFRRKEVTLAHRHKISLSKLGKKREPFSDQWLLNLSKSHKGRVFSEIHRYNLSLSSRGENNNMSKLTESLVREIKCLLLSGKLTQQQIADIYKVSRSLVYMIKANKAWSYVLVEGHECD